MVMLLPADSRVSVDDSDAALAARRRRRRRPPRSCIGLLIICGVCIASSTSKSRKLDHFLSTESTDIPVGGTFSLNGTNSKNNNNNNNNNQSRAHNPRRFSAQTELNVARGLNLLHGHTGQRISAWIYDGTETLVNQRWRSWGIEDPSKFLRTAEDVSKLRHNDTIHVAHCKLDEFARSFLPHISTDTIIISSSFRFVYPDGLEDAASNITNHPNIVHWFSTNSGFLGYTGGQRNHSKVSSFPIGLKPNMGGRRIDRNPVPYFRSIFMEYYNQTIVRQTLRREEQKGDEVTVRPFLNKSKILFAGYLAPTGESRKGIPSEAGSRLPYTEFLRELADSYYVLSPDGDHPDCHRHYEAIGLGAIPITQLDPAYYTHLDEGRVIYKNNEWNVTKLRDQLQVPNKPTDRPNHNMIFEEFWIEYIERKINRKLKWWDVLQNRRCFLDEFEAQIPEGGPASSS